MRLTDVMNVVGASKLDDFPWGPSVVDLVNSFAPDSHQLTLESTGTELEAAVTMVDESHRAILLQAKVGLKLVNREDKSSNDEAVAETISQNKTKSILSMVFAAVLCLIAVMLTFSITYNNVTKGTPMDLSGLQSILQIMLEFFQATDAPPAAQ